MPKQFYVTETQVNLLAFFLKRAGEDTLEDKTEWIKGCLQIEGQIRTQEI